MTAEPYLTRRRPVRAERRTRPARGRGAVGAWTMPRLRLLDDLPRRGEHYIAGHLAVLVGRAAGVGLRGQAGPTFPAMTI